MGTLNILKEKKKEWEELAKKEADKKSGEQNTSIRLP